VTYVFAFQSGPMQTLWTRIPSAKCSLSQSKLHLYSTGSALTNQIECLWPSIDLRPHLEVLHHCGPLLLCFGPLVFVHRAVVDPHKAFAPNICQHLQKPTSRSKQALLSFRSPVRTSANALAKMPEYKICVCVQCQTRERTLSRQLHQNVYHQQGSNQPYFYGVTGRYQNCCGVRARIQVRVSVGVDDESHIEPWEFSQ